MRSPWGRPEPRTGRIRRTVSRRYGLNVADSEGGASGGLGGFRGRSRDLVEPTDEIFYGVDLDGRCTFASESAGRVLGYEVEELLGEDLHELIHHTRVDGSPYPKEECPVHRTLRTGAAYRVADEVYWRKDGGLLPAECSSHPIVENGELRGAVVHLVDANERGRIEAARRTGEERYRVLTEAATDGILLSEEDGTISSANDAAGRIFGYETGELVGMRLADLMPGRFRPAYEAAFARYLETGERAHPWRSVRSYGLRKDGEEVPVEISYGEVSIGGKRSFIGLYRDVTEWEEAEELRARYASILEATPDLVGTVDAEGRLLSLNRAGRRMLGVGDEEDVSGALFCDYLPRWAAEVMSEQAMPAAARKGVWSGDTAFVAPDGGEIPVSQLVLAHKGAGGEVRFFSTIARDVTEARRTERQFAYYAMLLENVGDTVVATDEDLIVTAWNRGAEETYGWKAEEAIGRHVREVVPSDVTPEEREEAFRQLAETGSTRTEVTAYREDGAAVEIEGLVVVLRDQAGRTSGYLSIGRDVTERKRVGERVRFQAHLLDQVRAAIIATDLDGTVTQWNEYASRLYGWSREEAIGGNITDLTVGSAQAEAADEVMAQMRTGGPWEGEFEVRRKDGSYFPAHVSNSLFYDAAGEEAGIVGVSTDATERRRSEEAVHETLRYARRYASQLLGLSGAALTISSARSVNDMLEAITVQARELIGARRAVTSLDADDGSGEAIAAVSRADAGGDAGGPSRVSRGELEVLRREGRPGLSAPLTGRDGGDLGLIQLSGKREGGFDEVDQAVLSQLAQLASVALENARLYQQARSTIDSLSAQISILDETGAVVAVNRAWREFAHANGGTDESVNEGANYLGVCDASAALGSADAAAMAEGIRAVVSGRQESFEMEYPCPSPDRKRWFVARVTRFPDLEPPRLAVAHEDVTDHKRASESMLEIREAERRRLARDLHDVVLQDIAGVVQGLQAAQVERGDGDDGPDLSMELEALRRSVGNLRDVIYDLRSEKELRFVRAVESLVELNRQAAPERELRLEIEDQFPTQLPDVVGQELLRVLQEALVNVRRHSEAGHVTVVLGVDGNGVRAGISDDGRGFDPDEVGDGFGLSGMRERVASLGGELSVESSPGAGTRVEVRVPL